METGNNLAKKRSASFDTSSTASSAKHANKVKIHKTEENPSVSSNTSHHSHLLSTASLHQHEKEQQEQVAISNLPKIPETIELTHDNDHAHSDHHTHCTKKTLMSVFTTFDKLITKEEINACLIEKDIRVNQQANDGEITLLMLASVNGSKEMVEQFLKMDNIDLSLQDTDGNTALHHAVQGGKAEIVNMLKLKCEETDRPDILMIKNNAGKTPQEFAQEIMSRTGDVVAAFQNDPNRNLAKCFQTI